MSELYFNLQHSGGTHRVEIENQGDTSVIRFGASFTLRLDEKNLNRLVDTLQHELDHMRTARRNSHTAEDDFVQAGIKAREALKAQRRNTLSAQQKVDVWNPNDPSNW